MEYIGSAEALLDLAASIMIGLAVLYWVVLFAGFLSVLWSIRKTAAVRRYAPLALQIHVRRKLPSGKPGELEPLPVVLRHVLEGLQATLAQSGGGEESREDLHRFAVQRLVTGRPVDSALGIMTFMRVPDEVVYAGMAEGLAAIEREVASRGSDDDRVCLRYILHARTGDLPRRWSNGVMDAGRPAGMALQDFVDLPDSVTAGLRAPHVAALRLYTSAA